MTTVYTGARRRNRLPATVFAVKNVRTKFDTRFVFGGPLLYTLRFYNIRYIMSCALHRRRRADSVYTRRNAAVTGVGQWRGRRLIDVRVRP